MAWRCIGKITVAVNYLGFDPVESTGFAAKQ
jgi:hypothetical protein